MNEWAIGLITLVCVYAGALLGLGLQRLLPEHHLSSESKDAVKLVAGLLATLSALVLALLIASAKGSFDAVSNGLKQSAAKVVVIDRLLAEYGPEARDTREQLKRHYAARVARLFPQGRRDHDLGKFAPEASAAIWAITWNSRPCCFPSRSSPSFRGPSPWPCVSSAT